LAVCEGTILNGCIGQVEAVPTGILFANDMAIPYHQRAASITLYCPISGNCETIHDAVTIAPVEHKRIGLLKTLDHAVLRTILAANRERFPLTGNPLVARTGIDTIRA
jgi:hypothetical protein